MKGLRHDEPHRHFEELRPFENAGEQRQRFFAELDHYLVCGHAFSLRARRSARRRARAEAVNMGEKKDIAAITSPMQSGAHGVLIILRAEAFVELYESVPQPGVLLAPETAREFARQILAAADDAERRDGQFRE